MSSLTVMLPKWRQLMTATSQIQSGFLVFTALGLSVAYDTFTYSPPAPNLWPLWLCSEFSSSLWLLEVLSLSHRVIQLLGVTVSQKRVLFHFPSYSYTFPLWSHQCPRLWTSNSGTTDIRAVRSEVLCIVGCLAVLLASTYYADSTPFLWQPKISPDGW